MEVIAIALVGCSAVLAWWDVQRKRADNSKEVELLRSSFRERLEEVEKDIRGIWNRLHPIEELAKTTHVTIKDVSYLKEQMLDTRNSVSGLKTLASKPGKYGK